MVDVEEEFDPSRNIQVPGALNSHIYVDDEEEDDDFTNLMITIVFANPCCLMEKQTVTINPFAEVEQVVMLFQLDLPKHTNRRNLTSRRQAVVPETQNHRQHLAVLGVRQLRAAGKKKVICLDGLANVVNVLCQSYVCSAQKLMSLKAFLNAVMSNGKWLHVTKLGYIWAISKII